MSENEKRKHRCCFTGHRPEKLNMSEFEVKKLLEKAIDEAINDGFTTFISGEASGSDYGKQIFMQSNLCFMA